MENRVAAREAADSRFIISASTVCAIGRFARSNFITVAYLGFRSQSLAFTPGFTPSPRSAG
jgi:hypothetical protein